MYLKIQVTLVLVSKKWLNQANLVKNEMTPQQLKRSERIQKPNPKYVDIAIIEDEVKELETYVETSQNTAWQQAWRKKV